MNKKQIISVSLFPIFLIFLNFYLLVFNFNFYEQEFYKHNIYSKYSKETIDNNAKLLVEYMKFDTDSLETNFFNEKEKLHMIDVRNLICIAEYVLLFSFLIVLILFMLNRKQIFTSLYYGSIITIVLMFLAIMLSPQFDSLFRDFHLIAFNNEYWILNPETDNLKYIFPDEFFYDFLKTVFIRTFIISLLILILTSRKSLYIIKKKISIWQK